MNYKQFTILCVDDDEMIRNVYKGLFSYMFKKVFFASNGKEGLEIFKKYAPDIILTDEVMPEMNGLEMIKEIRKIDKDIPIILVSAFDKKDMLVNAINLNVTFFIKKPITKENLLNALEKAVKFVLANKILYQNLKNKIEYKDYQEKLALEKEQKIIKTEKNIIEPFNIETFYSPLDITSGDSYSIRRKCIFLVDAMGKGLSASITAMLATAFFNYLVDRGDYFQDIVNETSLFMKKNLLDYEILCFGFYKIEKDMFYFASFGMPPVFIERNQKIEKIKSNNLPLTSYTKNINFSSVNIKDAKKILICSDGLTENTTKNDEIYLNEIQEDFLNSDSINEFEQKRKSKISKQDDDITYFFLKKITKNIC